MTTSPRASEGPPIRLVDFDATDRVADRARLADLDRAVLCDTEPEQAFDRLTELIVELLGVPVALVSLVDGRRQFFKSQQGLPEPWATARETPLSHSFCQYLVAADSPLVIEDSRVDPTLADNMAVPDLGVIAYAGFPIRGREGHAIGSLCAIDTEPRAWADAHLALLAKLADVVSDLVQVRTEAMVAEDRRATISQLVASQEDERGRIAAELHDDSLQALAAVSIKLQLLGRQVEEGHADEVDVLVGELNAAALRMRRFVSDLRPDAFEHDTLANVLRTHLVNRASDHPGVTIDLVESTTAEPSGPARITLYRIAQQAIANAYRHASAKRLEVEVRTVGDATEIQVVDDGVGFDTASAAPTGHFGLRIMRERAELVGGHFELHSEPGRGTTVLARVPNSSDS